MEFNYSYFVTSFKQALLYTPVTLKILFVTFTVSFVLGILIGAIRFYKVPFLSKFFSAFVTVYMGIPIMVALVLYNLVFLTCYTDFANFFHISKKINEIDQIVIAYVALIASNTCSMSEITRGGFRSVDKVQFEAGYTIGLTKFQTFRRIIFPQMLPVISPGLLNLLIGMLKSTNLVSTIGIMEIMVASLYPCQETYSYLEGYLAAALMYWIIGIAIENLGHLVEHYSDKYRKKPI